MSKKIVVFDLDETLGYFKDVGLFWYALNKYKKKVLYKDFYYLMELFPQVFRPLIYKILEYLKEEKLNNKCNDVLIYTNNKAPKVWCELIVNYLNKKINHVLITKIINSFEINKLNNGEKHNKNITELLKYGNIKVNTKVCYIDDTYYPLMNTDNILYIKVKPYKYPLNIKDICCKYYNSILKTSSINISKNEFIEIISKNILKSKISNNIKMKSKEDLNIDKIVSKQIIQNLKDFLDN